MDSQEKTLQDARLVQASFQKLVPVADQVADMFYDRLFELDPELRPLFKGDMKEQTKKLMQMLAAAVKGLDDLDELIPVVSDLGARHAGYGVADAHYDTVGYALMWTLEQKLGEGFTPATKEAWAEVYGVLATTMKEAGNAVSHAGA